VMKLHVQDATFFGMGSFLGDDDCCELLLDLNDWCDLDWCIFPICNGNDEQVTSK
jgi:hypothetical protein